MNHERTYLWFSILTKFAWGLTATAYPVFERSIGLSNTEIFLIEAAFSIALLLSEVPTGMLADGKGRGWSVSVGTFIWGAGIAGICFCHQFWSVLAMFCIIGVGSAFLSGALEAWLKDALISVGQGERYLDVTGRTSSLSGIAIWTGGIIGALSLAISARAFWFFSGVAILGACSIAVYRMRGHGEPKHRTSEFQALRLGWLALRSSRVLIWATAAGLIFPFFWVAHLQWQPKVYEHEGILPLMISWTTACLGIIAGGWVVRRFIGREAMAMLWGLACIGLMLIGMGAYGSSMMMIMLFGWKMGGGVYETSSSSFIQDRIDSAYRATFGSLQSLLGRIACTAIFLFMAYRSLHQEYALAVQDVFRISGLLVVVGVGLLWCTKPAPVTAPKDIIVGS